jgi:fructokinase
MSDTGLCIFGEVLYDSFPDGQQVLGGAPFNVAWHAQAFGLAPHFISRVGNDDAGERVIAAMRNWGMSLAGLQQDSEHPTGMVQVSLAANDEPTYDIVPDSAWDFIDSALLPAAHTCNFLYHGTLALRNPVSRAAAVRLRLQTGGSTFVDINLRPPWWDTQTVTRQLEGVSGVKLNSDELRLLVPEAADLEQAVAQFMTDYAPDMLIVTLGSAGALAVTGSGEKARIEPDSAKSVVDTVGAGDAFMSVVLLGVIRRWPLQTVLQRAQGFASAIVGVRGATVSDAAFYEPFIEAWELS